MTEWLKGCEVCNAGLCARFDELIESGEGYREAARLLQDEQKEKLGEIVYSESSLLNRYYRNKPEVFRNGTGQDLGEKKQKPQKTGEKSERIPTDQKVDCRCEDLSKRIVAFTDEFKAEERKVVTISSETFIKLCNASIRLSRLIEKAVIRGKG
jgi:hypothetical protein